MVALYRPGPIELIPDYIKGKHGQRKITYLHPKLEPILKDTYGIAVFQEQVLQIAREIAGFTLGEADILRKAVGKKIRKLLLQQQRKFIDGAQKNGIKKEIAEKIFLFIEPFASYGFNRAHAACYGLIAYQTAYLKSHHPSEFMAALLSSEQTNIDKISVAITECERLKIKVLPPDVNESFVEFGVDKDTGNIRFALAAIKNVGEGAAQAIVEERQQNGLYQNLEDFSQRLTTQVLNKKIVESLGKAGALDRFGERNQMLAGVEEILKFAGKKSGGTAPQMALFGQTAEEQVGLGNIRLPMIDPASKKQRLSWEKELLGMYLTEHPLKEINHIINQKATPISDLSEEMTGHKVKVAGIITAVQKILTKAKEPMLFAWLEDLTSRTEILVFPKLLQKNNLIWQVDNIVLIEGNLNTKDGALKILADSVEELGHQTSLSMAHDSNDLTPNEQVLTVTLPKGSQKEILNQLKAVVTQFPGDVPLMLKIPLNGEYRVVKTKTKVKISPRLLYDLGQIVGQRNVKAEEGGNINSNFKPQNSK
jgi:DNA polymerase-3 subunit alpha